MSRGATMSGTRSVLTLHPEAVPGDPGTLRWVVPPGVLPFEGAVRAAPGALGECLVDGTLARVACEDAAVVTTLGPYASWADDGERVRSAVASALADPGGWSSQDAPTTAVATGGTPAVRDGGATGGGTDATAAAADAAEVAAAVRRVLDGPAGDYVRGHGGRAEFVGLRDGFAEIRLTGACAHCPASTATLKGRLEGEILARVPQVTGVREAPGGLRRSLARLGRRPAGAGRITG